MKRIAVATVLLLCAAILFGCADYAEKKQAEAIVEAMAQMEKDAKAFCHFEYEDIIAQLKAKPSGDSEFEFALDISLPDLAAIANEAINVIEPFCDYNKPNVAAYETAYIKAAENGIDDYVEDADNLVGIASELRFTLKKSGMNWTAEYNGDDAQAIVEKLSADMDAKAKLMLAESEGYRKAQIAEHIKANMSELFADPQYAQSAKISGIERTDGGHAVTLRFPDPNAVYEAAAEACFAEYRAMDTVYGYIGEEDVAGVLQPHIAASIKGGISEIEGSLVMQDGFAYGQGYNELKKSVEDARASGYNDIIFNVNNELALKPWERPKSGVLTGPGKGQTVTVTASDDLGDMYLAFYKLPGDSVDDDGELTLTAYVRSGDTINLRLPVGNYKMIEATGDDWFGESVAFGPNGSYEVADELMVVESGLAYTLTLYGVSDGNLPTTKIPYPFGN